MRNWNWNPPARMNYFDNQIMGLAMPTQHWLRLQQQLLWGRRSVDNHDARFSADLQTLLFSLQLNVHDSAVPPS